MSPLLQIILIVVVGFGIYFAFKWWRSPLKGSPQAYTQSQPKKLLARSVTTKVVGVSFGRRQSYLKSIAKEADKEGYFIDIDLVPDPNNEYDKHAIKVMDGRGRHLGFISKDEAKPLSDFMRRYEVIPSIEDILGYYEMVYEDFEGNLGCLLRIDVYAKHPDA